jgi:uncharacterized membrane protein YidH (DUF202 family)
MKNTIAFVIGFAGFLLMVGVAGSDCDGKCMENALPLGETIIYALIGLGMMVAGAFIGGFFNGERQ